MRTWIRGVVAAAVISTSVVGALPASAASDVFLSVDGIKGESLDEKHKGEIEILSWSWGTVGAGKPGSVSFTKNIDKASPGLINASLNNNRIKKATLVVRRGGAGGRGSDNYIKITLEDVVVSSVNLSGAGGPPMEQVTFTFAKVKFDYSAQKADGSAEAAGSVSWDGAKVKELSR